MASRWGCQGLELGSPGFLAGRLTTFTSPSCLPRQVRAWAFRTHSPTPASTKPPPPCCLEPPICLPLPRWPPPSQGQNDHFLIDFLSLIEVHLDHFTACWTRRIQKEITISPWRGTGSEWVVGGGDGKACSAPRIQLCPAVCIICGGAWEPLDPLQRSRGPGTAACIMMSILNNSCVLLGITL